MPDPVNDMRPIEEKVFDLQLQAEALRMDLQAARGQIAALRAITKQLVNSAGYQNRLAIAAEFEAFFGYPVPVKDDGGGGK